MRTQQCTDSTRLDRFLTLPAARVAVSLALVASAWGVASLLPVGQPAQPLALAAASAQLQRPQLEATALPGYIAKRWGIDVIDARDLVRLARQAAESNALDPLLVLAVIARESSFQHNGNAGTLRADVADAAIDPRFAHGLMQVAGRHHDDKMPKDAAGRMRVTTAEENVHIGSRILREYLERDGGNVSRALQRYNGNLADPDRRFASYVLRVRDHLERVAKVPLSA